jgi:hypothetical protein
MTTLPSITKHVSVRASDRISLFTGLLFCLYKIQNDGPNRLTVYTGVDDCVAWHVKQLCIHEASMRTSDQLSATRHWFKHTSTTL